MIQLTPSVATALTYQDYSPQAEIHGVFYHGLRKHRAAEGWFMEHLRLNRGSVGGMPVPFEPRQISLSRAEPGRLNAFHLHPREVQDELWCVIEGLLTIWLVDCRTDSPTATMRRRYVLNAEEPGLLHIPSGVAHGYRAGPQGALLLYAMNNQFNPEAPNEGRLPWDFFGTHLWDEDRG